MSDVKHELPNAVGRLLSNESRCDEPMSKSRTVPFLLGEENVRL